MGLFSLNKTDLDKKKAELEHLKGEISADKKLADVEKQYREGVTT